MLLLPLLCGRGVLSATLPTCGNSARRGASTGVTAYYFADNRTAHCAARSSTGGRTRRRCRG
ncbi:MAG TPA: hypothetical protein VLA64_13750, partial [Azonexus sp.]|nr:hypothetical protein [Azonexus sp.]